VILHIYDNKEMVKRMVKKGKKLLEKEAKANPSKEKKEGE
jgi:hypothetical protein